MTFSCSGIHSGFLNDDLSDDLGVLGGEIYGSPAEDSEGSEVAFGESVVSFRAPLVHAALQQLSQRE
jgi:hypothetical protein